jgi:hypothetical protein
VSTFARSSSRGLARRGGYALLVAVLGLAGSAAAEPVSGQLLREVGEQTYPVRYTRIEFCEMARSGPCLAAFSDGDGRYALRDVPPGTYRVEVTTSDGSVFEEQAAIRAGTENRRDFVLPR